MREQLRTFITSHLMKDAGYPLEDDEGIISGGLIDSFSLVELQLFIEVTFGVKIPDVDMTVDTADTLDDVLILIERTQASQK
jgi:acyl carrier protein